MACIIGYHILLFVVIFDLSVSLALHFKTPLLNSLIQRRQILDGTAKSGGVAPKPPGSDHVFDQHPVSSVSQVSTMIPMSSITTTATTAIRIREAEEDRSIKETLSSNSSSKSNLLASILAPTGVLGLLGLAVSAFLYKKNQTNSVNSGFLSNFFNRNTNAIETNKSEEKYLLVGNISYSSSAGVALLDEDKRRSRLSATTKAIQFTYELSVIEPPKISPPPGNRAGAFDVFKPNSATASSSIHTATS